MTAVAETDRANAVLRSQGWSACKGTGGRNAAGWIREVVRACRNLSATSACTSPKSGRTHVWPEFMNEAQAIRLAACSRFAVLSTIVGDFPPSSRLTGVRNLAAASATSLPTYLPMVAAHVLL